MNNGERKGGDPEYWQIVRTAPGLQDFWQLHRSAAGGADHNSPEQFLANVNEVDHGHYIKMSVRPDGSFTMTNPAGTLNATTITLALNTFTPSAGGPLAVSGTFNLNNGTVTATTIQQGAQTGAATATLAFNWAGGTIQNTTGADLTITTPVVVGTAAAHQAIVADGALVVKSLGEATKLVTGDAPGLDLVIYGCVLVLVVAFAPGGIVGLFDRARKLLRRRERRQERANG